MLRCPRVVVGRRWAVCVRPRFRTPRGCRRPPRLSEGWQTPVQDDVACLGSIGGRRQRRGLRQTDEHVNGALQRMPPAEPSRVVLFQGRSHGQRETKAAVVDALFAALCASHAMSALTCATRNAASAIRSHSYVGRTIVHRLPLTE